MKCSVNLSSLSTVNFRILRISWALASRLPRNSQIPLIQQQFCPRSTPDFPASSRFKRRIPAKKNNTDPLHAIYQAANCQGQPRQFHRQLEPVNKTQTGTQSIIWPDKEPGSPNSSRQHRWRSLASVDGRLDCSLSILALRGEQMMTHIRGGRGLQFFWRLCLATVDVDDDQSDDISLERTSLEGNGNWNWLQFLEMDTFKVQTCLIHLIDRVSWMNGDRVRTGRKEWGEGFEFELQGQWSN